MASISHIVKRKFAFHFYKSVISFRKITVVSLAAKGLKNSKEINSTWKRICELAKEEALSRSNDKRGIILFRRISRFLADSVPFKKMLEIKFIAKVLLTIHGIVLRKLTSDEFQKSSMPKHVNFSEYFLKSQRKAIRK